MATRRRRAKRPPKVRFPLREILRKHGLTQYRAAKMSGISAQLISNICCGRKAPSWRMLLHLLTSIGADLGDLSPKGGAA